MKKILMENFKNNTVDISLLNGENLYDLSLLTSMVNKEYLVKVLMIFLHETPLQIKEMKAAAHSHKNKTVAEMAHKIKGSAGIFKADKLIELLEEIELIAKLGTMNHELTSLVESAGQHYNKIEFSLQNYLSEIL